MLCRLTIINFIFAIQVFGTEGFMPSRNDMATATQQAEQIQKDARILMNKHPVNNIFEGQSSQKCWPSQPFNLGAIANKRCVKSIAPHWTQQDKSSQILIFISFSMPESSLRSLFQEASKHNAVLVTRGLVDDSFVKTAQKLQNLMVTVDINPDLFVTHNIFTVPTFILTKDGRPIHSLKGNVTLEFAAQKFKDQSVNKQPIISQQMEMMP